KSDAASEVRPTDYQTAMAVRRQLQSTGERGRAEAKSRNDEFHPLIGDARAKRQQDAGRGDQTDSRPRTDTTDEGRLSSLHAKDVPNEEKSLPVLLADIAKSERALLTQWQTAVLIFDNVTRSPSDKEGETQFASAVAKSVEKALLQEILGKLPGSAAFKAGADALKDWDDRREQSKKVRSAGQIRDFVDSNLRDVGELQALSLRNEEDFIAGGRRHYDESSAEEKAQYQGKLINRR